MERMYNKNKNKFSKLNRIVSVLLLLVVLIFSANAVTQKLITSYDFESGSGNVAIDRSGNNVNGLFYGNTKFDSNSKFGNYATKYDNGNDYIIGVNTNPLPKQLTISYWIKPETNEEDTILNIYDNNDMSFGFNFKNDNGKYFWYYDTNNNYQEITLFTNQANNNYVNFVYVLDFNNQTIKTYYNNNLMNNQNIPNILITNQTYNIRIGTDRYKNRDYKGYFDELNIFSGLLNQSQINQLYTNTKVTLATQTTQVNNTIQTNIIKSYTPNENTTNITINNNIEVSLYSQANCDLYINDNLVKSYNNILGFAYPLTDLTQTQYNYFVYCSQIINNTKNFELTNIINFSITKPSKTIQFLIYDKSGNLANNQDLYLITPCPKDNEFNKYYVKDNKTYYIQNLVNGRANYNLSYDGNYNFCLMHGKINYKDNTYTNDYDFVDILKKVDLGTLFVGNSTLSYSLKVDDTDLYTPLNPHFWGKDWSALFQLVIGVLLGGLLILLGILADMNKLVVVGGLIIAIGMGVSITTFVGAIL